MNITLKTMEKEIDLLRELLVAKKKIVNSKNKLIDDLKAKSQDNNLYVR